ncbi:MAG: electron transfer flavoprotein subunit alpha/FixB family protein, partial [Deltaproteobacteria bacterium]|nr:electron transfer flavoprotein subunit alpha/FixB family protein [Deltaproteobacteria bacterium]
ESVELVRITRYQPENILEALTTLERRERAHLYLFPSGFAGCEIAVRLAFRMKGSSLVQVKRIDCSKTHLIAKKTVYASHVLGTFKLKKKPYCVSLAKGCADSRPVSLKGKLAVTEIDMTHLRMDPFVKTSQSIPMKPAKNLARARFLLIGGQGMHNGENTQRLKQIADAMGADFGVSRPAAMRAWAPMHRLVGVSGAMTKAEVCIVAGVSGAPAFYAGIEKSKFIVAINKDLRAPIVKTADVAIIDDYRAVMEGLGKFIQAQTGKDICFEK